MESAIVNLASSQLSLVTRAQLGEIGLSQRSIDGRLARGGLRVVHPAVYSMPGVPDTWERRVLAAFLAVPESAVSHLAAGMFWGLEGVKTERPDLLIAHNRRIYVPGLNIHRTRTLEPRDLQKRSGLVVTSPSRTLIDLASVLPRDELENALDDALRRTIVSVRGLTDRLAKIGGGIARLGSLRRLVADRAGGPAMGSPAEARFRRRLARSGLPMPVPQYEVLDGSGKLIARVDFAYPDKRLALEIDGWTYHSGRRRRAADIARQNRLIVAGWTFLRFGPQEAAGDPRVLDQIASVIGEPNPRKPVGRTPQPGRIS